MLHKEKQVSRTAVCRVGQLPLTDATRLYLVLQHLTQMYI